ncbi:MAG: YihY/virulence factor BrkB family protein [Capsulimonadaceae bacterium]|nr:YihY/virulence factor BrkB family protein [Capsulimonadaceae bacterium]
MRDEIKAAASRPWLKYPIEAIRRFGKNNGSITAAGVAFFLILSLPPASLLAVAVLGFTVNRGVAVAQVHTLIARFVPSGDARTAANDVITPPVVHGIDALAASSTPAFWIGLLILVWSAMQVYVVGSVAMNVSFEVLETRSWLRVRLVALSLLCINGALLFLSVLLTGAAQAVLSGWLPLFGRESQGAAALSIVAEAVAVLLNVALFSIVYKTLPAATTRWKPALAGGVVASLMFEIAKKGLAAFLLRPNHGVYGGLADVILLVLWIYYSTIILMLGAEFAAVCARHQEPPMADEE